MGNNVDGAVKMVVTILSVIALILLLIIVRLLLMKVRMEEQGRL